MNNRCQNSEKTKRLENICNSLKARVDLQVRLTDTANNEKGILGALNTVGNSTFSDHTELNVGIGQTVCSEQTPRYQAISSETGNTSEGSSSDESSTNSKGSRPFHCLECGKSFTKETHLYRHQKIHHEKPKDQNHATHLSRSNSRNFEYSDIARKPVSLEHKGIIAENRSSLFFLQEEPSNCVLGIEKTENFKMKLFVCSVCQKSFKNKIYLKKHMRIHSREKPYECEVCNKSFLQRVTLTQHIRTHTGEKPYKCEVCNKSFSLLSSLTQHARIHTGEKSYKCELCNKTFATNKGLYQHKFNHMENSFKCEVCNKTFAYKYNLRRHIRIHAKHFESK